MQRYISGAWPETITLNATTGDRTVIVIVAENGVTTTINADGTVTTGQYTGSGSNSNTGDNTSGSNPEPGTVNPEPGNGGGGDDEPGGDDH